MNPKHTIGKKTQHNLAVGGKSFFKPSLDLKVKGCRHIFALNHKRMKNLQPFLVTTRFKQHENFPVGHSLFIPCSNFQDVKTSGYLCALRIRDLWRLAVIQGVDIQSDGNHIVYFLYFKKRCTSDVIFRAHGKYLKEHKLFLITKYCEQGEERVKSGDLVPLVEVSRYFTGDTAAEHMHISERDGCFEQPKQGPDYWWQAVGPIFQNLFQTKNPECIFVLKARKEMILRKTTTQIVLNRKTKKARIQEKDRECYDRTGPDELIQMAAKEMLDWKVMDLKGKCNPVPIYYVREHVKAETGNKKYYLVPFKKGCGKENVVTFGKVSISQKDKLVQEVSGLSPEEYDEKLLSFCENDCVDLFIVDPRKHYRGFVFSILGSEENIPEEAKEIFSSSTVTIYKEDRQDRQLTVSWNRCFPRYAMVF